jgi:Zinc finger, C2H2 type
MEKSPKIPKIFSCEACDYNTSNKKDLAKHFTTAKHLNRTASNENIPKQTYYVCPNCTKEYKAKSSLWYHTKKCMGLNEDRSKMEAKLSDTNDQLCMITELLKQNQELQKQILEISKEGKHYTNNNNITNNNTKNFNLNFFLNETCKDAINLMDFVNSLQLKLTDFENTGRLGYVEGISKIIVNGLKQMDVHKRPIHCTDIKRETMYVKDQDSWEKENNEKSKLTQAVKIVATKNLQQMQEWQKIHPECAVNNTPQNEDFMNIMLAALGGQTEEEDDKNREKILRNIAKEVLIDKDK